MIRTSDSINLVKMVSLYSGFTYGNYIIENKANTGSPSEVFLVFSGTNLGGSSVGKILIFHIFYFST